MVPESCTATVAEWELCYDELFANYAGLYDDVPACETLTLETAAALMLPAELPTTPASCVTAQMKCSVDEPDPPPDTDPLIAACTASCQRFETTCGITMDPTCSSWCGTEQLLGELYGCLEINQSFYECGRTAELDCTEDKVRLAIDGTCGIHDVTYCQLNEGVTCGRSETFDSYCADALPETPEAFQCVSTVPYGECLDHPTYGATFRCCPAGTSF